MRRVFCLLLPVVWSLPLAGSARADDRVLDALHHRIAADLAAGRPLVVRIHVALCDNASQGIVPVKNGAICDGEVPERNLYWATSGGLRAVLDRGGFRRAGYARVADGPVAIRARWVKRHFAGRRLRALGAPRRFDVEVQAVAYRGRHIGGAMAAYLADVHGRGEGPSAPHVVGYIGHNHLLDVERASPLPPGRRADAALVRGVFALSCFGERVIRPLITRPNAPVLVLNRSLTYPGAWTVEGLVRGLAAGAGGRGIHRLATRHFARGKGKPAGALGRVFSYGSPASDAGSSGRVVQSVIGD